MHKLASSIAFALLAGNAAASANHNGFGDPLTNSQLESIFASVQAPAALPGASEAALADWRYISASAPDNFIELWIPERLVPGLAPF